MAALVHHLDLVYELLHIRGLWLKLEQTFNCNSNRAFSIELACEVAFGMGP